MGAIDRACGGWPIRNGVLYGVAVADLEFKPQADWVEVATSVPVKPNTRQHPRMLHEAQQLLRERDRIERQREYGLPP